MKKIFLLCFLAFFQVQAFACFDIQKVKLKNHLLIQGMNVNLRLILINNKKEEIKDFGLTEVTDITGKESRKDQIDFGNGMIRLNSEQLPKDNLIQIHFITLKKTIRLQIDPNKEPPNLLKEVVAVEEKLK